MLIVVFKLLDVKPVHFAATHILGFCTKKKLSPDWRAPLKCSFVTIFTQVNTTTYIILILLGAIYGMTQTSPTWYIILILQGAIYGMAQTIPDKSMVTDLVGCFLNALYSTDKQ